MNGPITEPSANSSKTPSGARRITIIDARAHFWLTDYTGRSANANLSVVEFGELGHS